MSKANKDLKKYFEFSQLRRSPQPQHIPRRSRASRIRERTQRLNVPHWKRGIVTDRLAKWPTSERTRSSPLTHRHVIISYEPEEKQQHLKLMAVLFLEADKWRFPKRGRWGLTYRKNAMRNPYLDQKHPDFKFFRQRAPRGLVVTNPNTSPFKAFLAKLMKLARTKTSTIS